MQRIALVLGALLSLPSVPWALPVQSERRARSFPLEDHHLFRDFLSGSLEVEVEDDASSKRMGRRETFVGLRHHCSKPSEHWSAVSSSTALFSESILYRVTVTTASSEPPWKVFPLWHLILFMKRFYNCCRIGYPCKKIKGYQGRLIGHDDREMEFFLRPEYLFVNVLRAQMHLNVANPDRVMLEAEIRVKMQGATVATKTRNIIWHTMSESELAFDTLFLFKFMKETHLKEGGGTTQFLLILKCSLNNQPLSCRDHGISVLRAPFMAIGYV